MIKRIPIDAWEPDKGSHDPASWVEDLNAFPSPGGYAAVEQFGDDIGFGDLGTTDINGVFNARKDGDNYLFLGEALNIYRLSGTSPTIEIVSSATDAYSIPYRRDGGRWEFVQWEDEIYAFSLSADTQSMDVSATSFAVISGATSSTSIPRAKTVAISRNFLISGNTYDATDGTSLSRVRWSALNDPIDWTVSPVTQADFTDLQGVGDVLRVFGGEYAVVFTERSIFRMTYVGPPLIWQFDEVQPGRSLISSSAAVQKGDMIFALTKDGFGILRNGAEWTPIGRARVDNTFLEQFEESGSSTDLEQLVICSLDPLAERVHWFHPIEDAVYTYDYGLDKWGKQAIAISGGQRSAFIISYDLKTTGSEIGVVRNKDPSTNAITLFDGGSSLGVINTKRLELTPNLSSMIKYLTIGVEKEPDATGTKLDFSHTITAYKTPYVASDDGVSVTNNPSATSDPKMRYSLRSNGRQHRVKVLFGVDASAKNKNPVQLGYIDIEYVPTSWR